jgi:hypothetical protein
MAADHRDDPFETVRGGPLGAYFRKPQFDSPLDYEAL